MRVERLTGHHLSTVRDWWERRGEGSMPDDILPPCGYVAVDDGGPAAACWIYFPEGVALAIVDWLVSRPGLRPAESRAACRAVFQAACGEAENRGVRRIFATACRDGMTREAEACGFQVVARGATHLAKSI